MNSFWQYEFIDVIVFTQEISIFPFNQSRSTRNIFFHVMRVETRLIL